MRDKKTGSVAVERLLLLVAFVATYETITGGCLAALWFLVRTTGDRWLLR